jgi:epoxide hydrolase
VRVYADHDRQKPPAGPSTVRYAERDHAAIRSWTVHERGGHYAAHQAPELLVADIRAFFTGLRGGA